MLKTHRTSNEKSGYILKLRQSRAFKGIALTLALNLIVEMVHPTLSLALTEGPSQPEVQSFEPIGTTQMVDLFTGDFNYNIPLFNLPGPNGGYPVNLAYHAGISMDDEASWVGLGWNINPGALVRNMRGLPDEFLSSTNSEGDWLEGDFIETKTDMKESWTIGASFKKSGEFAGANTEASNSSLNLSLYFNNFRGLGMSVGFEPNQIGNSPFSYSLSLDSENGLGVTPSVSINSLAKENPRKFDLSLTFDGELSLNYGVTRNHGGGFELVQDGKKINSVYTGSNISRGASLSYSRSNFNPSIANKVNSYSLAFNFSKSKTFVAAATALKSFGIFFNTQDYSDRYKKGIKRPVMGYSAASGSGAFHTKDFSRASDGQITKNNPILPHSYYTADTYSSTGQGLMGYFRGMRNDVGRVNDPKIRNNSFGASLNLEVEFWEESTTVTQTSTIGPFPPVLYNPVTITNSSTTVSTSGPHWGIGGSISFGWNDQRPWDESNQLNYDFNAPHPGGIKENHYYKVHGEQTILEPMEFDHINGLDLALATFVPKTTNLFTGGERTIDANQNQHIQSERVTSLDNKRVVKNTLVHTFTNGEAHYLGEFNIRYHKLNANLEYTVTEAASGNSYPLARDKRSMPDYGDISINSHNAGFKVLNEEGSYYVYGLPAYNLLETENLFTVDAQSANTDIVDISTNNGEVDYKQNLTHKFINKTTKSPYAHSYMLTSVQGADYVDIKNDGPSDDDLGYWVKFNYVQYSTDSKWRAPYHGANYSQSEKYTAEDDKGSYQFGVKEQWYVGSIETKSHIAVFEMEERKDMKTAESEYANSGMGSQSGLKINRIKIYEKKSLLNPGSSATFADVTPLQTIHFEHDYSLCQGSPNSAAQGNGKLTLKKIWFTSLNSDRGELSPYEFDYTSVDVPSQYASLANTVSNPQNLVNPNYARNTYDPWGGYHPWSNGYEQHSHFPYIAQNRTSWNQSWNSLYNGQEETVENKSLTQLANDMLASTWCLRKIKLPSGGEIKIDYESDDYSHVQHKVANQLFKVQRFGYNTPNLLYQPDIDFNFENNPDQRRIYFKLEEPIPFGTTGIANKIFKDYVEPIIQDESGTRNLYIKSKVILKNIATPVEEYITGYLALENSVSFCGVSTQSAVIDGNNCYTEGYVTVQCASRKNGGKFENYHPLSLLAWQYMQTNAQELLTPGTGLGTQGTVQNASDLFSMATNVLGAIPATFTAFGAIRAYCQDQGFASTVNLQETGIRLASPDRKKYGGGHRVKKLTITDNWNSSTSGSATPEQSRSYGQIFEYTINENGKTISSGVAQYEPQAGGDENPLKYPIHFFGKQNLFTANNLMAEAPVNEALFPGPSVGYRKVSVKSLNTNQQIKNKQTLPSTAAGRTGGVSVHEFYTAKDFPTMVSYSLLSENNNTKDVFNVPIPIPFIGSIKRNYYHGSQAFKIELNDMHGKPKSVRTYELNDYKVGSMPITESTSEYQAIPIVYQGENVWKLDNRVRIVPKGEMNPDLSEIVNEEPDNNNNIRLMGVESELFTDQRENKSFWSEAGLDFNIDIISILGLPSFWPSYSNHKTLFRTYVTNKVVHRTGILKKSKSRDLQTVNETEVLAYDEKAGVPLISKVKNEFGDDFYSYNIPAYYHYDRMGHAYRNINYSFTANVVSFDSYTTNENNESGGYIEIPATNEMKEFLVRGDELLVTNNGNGNLHKKCYFLGWISKAGATYAKIHFPPNISNYTGTYVFKVIRSGRRNHYGTMSANYLTKGQLDPSANAYQSVGPVGEQVDVPKLNNVLSATASLFKDDWTTEFSINYDKDGNVSSTLLSPNPFISGTSGIWRPFKSYTYVGNREGSASMNNNTGSDPQLYQDGIMNSVPMFTWEIGNMEDYESEWEWVNEVTRFSSDAYELENVNRLGIHSSALYGYDNSLTIAVGGNASLHELGVFDFETAGSSNNYKKLLVQTNMNFDLNNTAQVFMIENYIVKDAIMNSGNQLTIKTTIPYTYWTNHLNGKVDTHIALTLTSRQSGISPNNEGYYFNGKLNPTVVNEGGFATFTATPYIEDENESDNVLQISTKHHGKISFLINRGANGINNTSAAVSSTKAHTGKKSLYITGESTFDQPQLKTIAGKKYVASLWVSKDVKKRTYKPGEAGNSVNELFVIGSRIGAGSFVPNQGITNKKVTYGKVIEGWQKIDVEFEATQSYMNLGFRFLENGGNALFVDDIRFSPKTGGITTYVYDPSKFWLRASLNVDNYATFFFYDEEGNLTIKKQETEDGIFTITESRGHVAE